ncbi:bud emergence protein 1 [Tulasnella sp. 403]|nr:bud emergence protein 1 [Tulasnella sp. 403]
MKSLRRSFNKDPPPISTPISTYPALSKPLPFQQPPKKVIRCTRPYRSQAPQELSCALGDVLYVVREIDSPEGSWYEVTNPNNHARGIVPKNCFDELSKTAGAPNPRMAPRTHSTLRTNPTKHQTFYAIVQYDFTAERPDELDAKAGEPISVVAQSNREWFVAKPIGRLGGPGLIPVSFVEIRDPLTNQPIPDVDALMDKGLLPRVEEWKQATAEYKASSIPLGVLDDATVGEGVKDSPFVRQSQFPPQQQHQPSPSDHSHQKPQARTPHHDRSPSQAQSFATSHSHSRAVSHHDPEPEPQNSDLLPPGTVIAASIPSFHYENDEYWFRIDATYQSNHVPPRVYQLILYRNYDDFYDFQISLLDAFPVEAGRVPRNENYNENGYPTPPASVEENSTRILPFMPGPVSYVDDMITSVRRTELDQYLNELCELEQRGAGHVLRHELVRRFFSGKSGDNVEEVDPTTTPAWKKAASANRIEEEDEEIDPQRRYTNDVDAMARDMDRMHLKPSASSHIHQRSSGGSDYAYASNRGSRGPSRTSHAEHDLSNGARHSGAEYGADRRSRGSSPPKFPHTRVESGSRPSSLTGGANVHSDPHPHYPGHTHSYSYSSASASLSPPVGQGHHPYSQGSNSARSSSGPPDATHSSPDAPPRNSDEQPQPQAAAPPFLKIKIFHSQSDDLIAIRVPPKVTFSQLMTKVRDRLGPNVSILRYRDSFDASGSAKSWREIGGDGDLREWIGRGDKLVLYAD